MDLHSSPDPFPTDPSQPASPMSSWASPGVAADAPRFRSAPTIFDEPRSPGTALVGSPVSRLQQRSLGQLLDGGFEVLRFRFRTIAIVASAIILPLFALPQMAVAWFLQSPTESATSVLLGQDLDSRGAGWAVLLSYAAQLGLMLATMYTGVAVAHLVSSWLAGNDPTPADVFTFLRSRLLPATGAWLLALLLKVIAGALCGFGLLYAVPMLSVLAPVIAVERLSPAASLSRSRSLVGAQYSTAFGVMFGWALASWILTTLAQAATGTVAELTTSSLWAVLLVVHVVTVLATVALTVVQVAVTVLFYVDLRVRTEGLDLDLQIPDRFDVAV